MAVIYGQAAQITRCTGRRRTTGRVDMLPKRGPSGPGRSPVPRLSRWRTGGGSGFARVSLRPRASAGTGVGNLPGSLWPGGNNDVGGCMLNLRAESGHLEMVGGTPIPRPGQRTPLYAAADLTPRRGMPPSRWSPGRPTRMGGPAAQQPFTDQPRLPGKRLVPARVRRRPVVAAALVLLAVVVAAWFAVRPGSGARHPQEGTPAGAGCGRAAWPSRR